MDRVKEVNKERLEELPKEEVIDTVKYELDPRRYANALVEEIESGVPASFIEKDELSQRQLMYYMDGVLNPYTGKETKYNITESYIMACVDCNAISKEYLNKYSKTIDEKVKGSGKIDPTSGDMVFEYEEITKFDSKEYQKLTLRAITNWQNNRLSQALGEYRVIKDGDVTPKDLIEDAIKDGIINAKETKDKLAFLKMGIQVFNIEKQNAISVVNVYVDGGGKELSKDIAKRAGVGVFDIEVEDDEDE